MHRPIIRPATAADLDRIAEVVAGNPGPEATAIAGSVARARTLWTAMIRMPGSPMGWQCTTVAEVDGRVLGVVQTGDQDDSVRITPGLALLAIRQAGPLGIVGLVRRMKALERVKPSPLPGAYRVRELHVDPDCRGHGIGGALLDYAEADARLSGYKSITLTTTTSNPARRLYERHGFRVVETRTDPLYEKYTGEAGRYRMLKEL